MIKTNFRNGNDFDIYHFTGKEVQTGNKTYKVYDKKISYNLYGEPKIIKTPNNVGKEFYSYFINIRYLEDDDRYYLIKLMFQPPLELG